MQKQRTRQVKDDAVRKAVWDKTGGRCWYCGKQTVTATPNAANRKSGDSNDWFTLDHIVPQIDGGDDSADNFLPCCMGCNRQKRSMSIDEYRSHIARKINNVPKFTDEQIEYLSLHGLNLPEVERHTFWGEMEQ